MVGEGAVAAVTCYIEVWLDVHKQPGGFSSPLAAPATAHAQAAVGVT